MAERRALASLDLGDNGGRVAFYSIQEAMDWVKADRDFWNQVASPKYPPPLNFINDGLSRLESEVAAANRAQSITGIANAIQEEYSGTRRVIHRSSIVGRALAQIAADYGLLGLRGAAAVAFPRSIGAAVGNVVSDASQFLGAVTMANVLSGVTKRSSQAAVQSLAMLSRHREGQWAEDREEVSDYLDAMTQQIAELENGYRDAIAAQGVQHAALVKSAETSRDEAIARITATDTLFREQMRLKAPADYWEEKHTEHVRRARKLFWLLVGSVWLGACAYVWVLTVLWHDLIQLLTGFGANTAAIIVISGLIAIIAALPLWFLRILVRFYLSEQHLATDARERKVMTMTYLALSDEGATSDKDRAIILAALFRPGNDGMVKNSGGPDLGPAAIFARFLDDGRG